MPTLTSKGSPAARSAADQALRFVEDLTRDCPPRDFGVRLWDGTRLEPEAGSPERFTLILNHPGALRSMFMPPGDISLGEAYIYRDFDVEGDLEAVFDVFDRLRARAYKASDLGILGARLLALPADRRARGDRDARLTGAMHSRRRDRDAVSYHYDVGNDFYELWLDDRMVYSCAYFESPDQDLHRAQEAKLDYICRKLRLREGERLLDIGCGWGGLVAHAGAALRGAGPGRHSFRAAGRVRLGADSTALGLADSCAVDVCDYRDVDGTFDKIVSVGMFEHVGADKLGEYFERAYGLLRPGGLFLNHGIACEYGSSVGRSRSFLNRYVFPDGDLLSLAATVQRSEAAGFEVRDVENLREHYAKTLRQWLRRLREHADEARVSVGDVTYRIWELYMTGAAHGFHTGRLNLYQTLLAKPTGGPSDPSVHEARSLPAVLTAHGEPVRREAVWAGRRSAILNRWTPSRSPSGYSGAFAPRVEAKGLPTTCGRRGPGRGHDGPRSGRDAGRAAGDGGRGLRQSRGARAGPSDPAGRPRRVRAVRHAGAAPRVPGDLRGGQVQCAGRGRYRGGTPGAGVTRSRPSDRPRRGLETIRTGGASCARSRIARRPAVAARGPVDPSGRRRSAGGRRPRRHRRAGPPDVHLTLGRERDPRGGPRRPAALFDVVPEPEEWTLGGFPQRILATFEDPDGPAGEERVMTAVAQARECRLVLALGGDNSITCPVMRGLFGDALEACGLVTVDAHHDLRDGVSNGSPVRRLVDAGLPGANVVQLGIADFSNSPQYAARAQEYGITVVTRDALRDRPPAELVADALETAGKGGRDVYVDLDVDVCDRAVAPGCPASAPGGISADELRRLAFWFAADARVKGMDITEVDATADAADRRTVRLAALLVLEAAAGLAHRLGRSDGPGGPRIGR